MAHACRQVGAIGMAMILGACSPAASPSGGPTTVGPSNVVAASPSVTASTLPAASPTPTATEGAEETDGPAERGWAVDPPKPLLMGSAVRVLVADLNVRYRPSTSARRTGVVGRDQVLLVSILPPVEADGYLWYYGVGPFGELPPLPQDPYAGTDLFGGWFAAMAGSTPYVKAIDPRCPADVDLKTLGAMLPAERLACFEGDVISLEGDLRPPPRVPPEIFGQFRPRWLADPNIVNFVSELGTDGQGLGLNLRFPASLERPADGPVLVRGHFDDPRSGDCTIALDPPWGSLNPAPVPDSVARLWCREMFVVEQYEGP